MDLTKQTLVLRFSITGSLCYLSHQETAVMFQRSLIRANVPVSYSQGFNPRPRLSLPLPRTVGVESENEIFSVVIDPAQTETADDLKQKVSQHLPAGCRLISAEIIEGKFSCQPAAAVYALQPKDTKQNQTASAVEKLNTALTAGDQMVVTRPGTKKKRPKTLDLAPYITSVDIEQDQVAVKLKITPAGTARLDEIMQLLELDRDDIAVPVIRKNIEWNIN